MILEGTVDSNIVGRNSTQMHREQAFSRSVLKINKNNFIAITLFLVSIYDPLLLPITLLYIVYSIGSDGIVCGCMKSLLFISFRSILNPGITNSYTCIGMIKWLLLLSLAFLLIASSKSIFDKKAKLFLILLFAFVIYAMADSFVVSGYPTVSIFKIFSWIFVFYSLIRGLYTVRAEDIIIRFMSLLFDLIIITSPFVIPLGVGFLRNGHSFQGITNQPNMLGVVVLIAFGLNLYLKKSKNTYYVLLVSCLCVIEGVFTKSRTCIFGIAILAIFYLIFNEKSSSKKTFIAIGATVLLLIIIPLAQGYIRTFIFKGQATTSFAEAVLASRGGQISNAIERINNNVMFGNGFMVPLNPDGKSYAFSFDLTVEPGNIILTVLSDSGVIGFLLFFFAFFYLFWISRREDKILLLIPFIITMTEMNFFSTNNMAIVYYVLFAYCLTKVTCHPKELNQGHGIKINRQK